LRDYRTHVLAAAAENNNYINMRSPRVRVAHLHTKSQVLGLPTAGVRA